LSFEGQKFPESWTHTLSLSFSLYLGSLFRSPFITQAEIKEGNATSKRSLRLNARAYLERQDGGFVLTLFVIKQRPFSLSLSLSLSLLPDHFGEKNLKPDKRIMINDEIDISLK